MRYRIAPERFGNRSAPTAACASTPRWWPSLDDPARFTHAGGCDPGGAAAAAGFSCARDMEFHARKDRGGDPFNIYDDADHLRFKR